MKYFLTVVLIAVYVVTSCLGLYLIKAADVWKSVPFAFGVLLYGLGAALWLVILRYLPLSFAFPIAAGGLIVCTMLTGRVFLKEAISSPQMIGAALIIFGIFFTAAARK
jgi:multidrug transporter EmrE-like cation transporter